MSAGLANILTIDLNEGRQWGDCSMCGEERRLERAVGWWCGPRREDIGATLPNGGTVGGMCVCRPCHDGFYSEAKASAS